MIRRVDSCGIPGAVPTANVARSEVRGRRRSRNWFSQPRAVLVIVGLLALHGASGLAQTKTPTDPKTPVDPKAPLKIPDRERMTFATKDGVSLSCDYFPGGFVKRGDMIQKLEGKSVVPIVLVHGWGGRGSDFDGFASALQLYGYAVLVPDLRGHGLSTTARTATGSVTLDPEKMNPRELQALLAGMVEDLETAKRFLLRKNNEELLNIELLGVVGAELGALVSMNWAVHDWSKAQLPAYKQGRDVKVMVYLSPPQSFRGYSNKAAINNPIVAGSLPTMIAVGANETTLAREADRLFRLLERKHAKPEETLKYLEVPTTLQGTQMLQARGLPTGGEVLRFLYANLNEKANQFPWTDRTNPLGN